MATVGELGQIDALSGAFMASLAAAIAITGMTKAGIPVSSSQAVVGVLVGYRLIQDGSFDSSFWLWGGAW